MKKVKTHLMRISIASLLILFTTVLSGYSQTRLSEMNQNLRYSRYSRISLKIIPLQHAEKSFTLQFVVDKIEEDPSFDNYLFSYALVESFQEEITDDMIIAFDQESLKKNTDRHFLFEEEVTLGANQSEAYAVFMAKDTRQGDEYVYHMDLISPYVPSHPKFGAYFGNDIPFDQQYLNVEESLLFKTSGAINLHQFFYPQEFPLPLPPMETKPAPVAKDIEVDYRGSFLVNVPQLFEDKGYYFIQDDTTSNNGLLIKTTPKSFPTVSTWEEMVQMVTYISTRQEHENLLKAENKKLALDEYWIRMTRSEEKAKDLIREYFRQVEFANLLFTDFKEGWATDRGMVYIIMGPPSEVYFELDRESWIYLSNNSNSRITFTFARIKNILTPNYYTLNRSRAYQPEWFKTITAWRNGMMVF
ncbi:GWxTD domain-containing protein [Lunatibacter salilacus]|uniref:GWxTD domain-containing protein n=1 Tax=Lunatibacter salilacus TaxID=2483804 RepID=UPI00131DF9B7|nr:GWxTD domain-containing protein [Lunatibacter salilacus]